MDKDKNEILLCNNACIGFLGLKGTGKTTQMQFYAAQLLSADPDITHYYYITKNPRDPSIIKSKIKGFDGKPKQTIIDADKSSIDQLCEQITTRYKTSERMVELQKLTTTKDRPQKHWNLLRIFGEKYPQCVDKNKNVVLAKTLLLIDDMGTDDSFNDKRGPLYELMISQRHLATSILFSIHSWTNVQKSLREQFTQLVVFDGIAKERLQQIFEEMRCEKPYYHFEQFYEIYCSDVVQQKGKRTMSHNFIYITTTPVYEMSLNWFKDIII